MFIDEKIFNIVEKFNRQNGHIYAKSCYEAKGKIPSVQRSHSSSSVMVQWGVSYSYAIQIFYDAGVITTSEVY